MWGIVNCQVSQAIQTCRDGHHNDSSNPTILNQTIFAFFHEPRFVYVAKSVAEINGDRCHNQKTCEPEVVLKYPHDLAQNWSRCEEWHMTDLKVNADTKTIFACWRQSSARV